MNMHSNSPAHKRFRSNVAVSTYQTRYSTFVLLNVGLRSTVSFEILVRIIHRDRDRNSREQDAKNVRNRGKIHLDRPRNIDGWLLGNALHPGDRDTIVQTMRRSR